MEVLTLALGRGFVASLDADCWERTFAYNRRNGLSAQFRPCDLAWTAHRNRNYWYAACASTAFMSVLPLHRLITECPSHLLVDHRDTDTMNNRMANLRIVTHQQNALNSRTYKNSRSPYRGITKRGAKWQAQIHFGGKGGGVKTIGYFTTPEDAARAWDSAALEMFGCEFTRFNFPPNRCAEAQ